MIYRIQQVDIRNAAAVDVDAASMNDAVNTFVRLYASHPLPDKLQLSVTNRLYGTTALVDLEVKVRTSVQEVTPVSAEQVGAEFDVPYAYEHEQNLALAHTIVERLNLLVRHPDVAHTFEALIGRRVYVPAELADEHPTLQAVYQELGLLGVLNGIVGAVPPPTGGGYIAVQREPDGTFTGFMVRGDCGTTEPKPDPVKLSFAADAGPEREVEPEAPAAGQIPWWAYNWLKDSVQKMSPAARGRLHEVSFTVQYSEEGNAHVREHRTMQEKLSRREIIRLSGAVAEDEDFWEESYLVHAERPPLRGRLFVKESVEVVEGLRLFVSKAPPKTDAVYCCVDSAYGPAFFTLEEAANGYARAKELLENSKRDPAGPRIGTGDWVRVTKKGWDKTGLPSDGYNADMVYQVEEALSEERIYVGMLDTIFCEEDLLVVEPRPQ